MPRIVKREANILPNCLEKNTYIHISDTVLIDKDWRPADIDKTRAEWNPHPDWGYKERDYGDRRVWADGFDAGYQACLEAFDKI